MFRSVVSERWIESRRRLSVAKIPCIRCAGIEDEVFSLNRQRCASLGCTQAERRRLTSTFARFNNQRQAEALLNRLLEAKSRDKDSHVDVDEKGTADEGCAANH